MKGTRKLKGVVGYTPGVVYRGMITTLKKNATPLEKIENFWLISDGIGGVTVSGFTRKDGTMVVTNSKFNGFGTVGKTVGSARKRKPAKRTKTVKD